MVPDIKRLANVLDQVRLRQPVVHAITNTITASDVANVIRTIGARPIMAVAVEEVEEIVSRADALVLNLGTPTPERVTAMLLAGRQANSLGKPVVFDPVGVTASRFRFDSALRIVSELRLAVIKGNRAEVGRLAGMEGELRGLDAVAGPTDLLAAANALSLKSGTVIAVSGERDLIAGNGQAIMVENGHPLMGRVTGTGCMLAAIIAAFAAVEPDAMVATVAAVACFGVAGERAGHGGVGPGGFKSALMDSLHALTAEQVRTGARISEGAGRLRV